MVKNNLLLNNQVSDDKLAAHQQPLKKIVNNLANENISCNKCKESVITRDNKTCVKLPEPQDTVNERICEPCFRGPSDR